MVSGAEHDGRTPQQKQQSSRVVPTAQMGKHPSRSGSLGNGVGRPLLFHPLPDDCTPLLTFVNSRSGVSQGTYLIHQLRRLLNPIQVRQSARGGGRAEGQAASGSMTVLLPEAMQP